MSANFHLKNLTLTGTGKKPATITFEKGLNVVAGASNTGKTFIFQCLDFMLGGQKQPKPIEESKGYEKIHLVISTTDGQHYTILRNITGGAFQIKQGNINESMPYEAYYEKLSNDPQNISTFLLSLCGLQDIQLKKNANNVKVRLSFRDVAGLCLVDEKTIISEESPIYHSGESVTRTKEQSLFYYFLIGEDATAIAEIEDPKILKNKIAGKIELVEELIQTTQAKLEEYKGQNVEGLEKELEAQYERLNLDYRTSIVEIDQLRNQKVLYYKNIEKLESKKLFNKELLDRFELLDKHYISDRNRLEFISEGSFLLNQLNNVMCPICGSDMNESHTDHLERFKIDNESFEISLGKELGKITLKQTELNQTISQLKEDNSKQQKAITKVKAKIDEIDEKLNNSLTPVSLSLRSRLQILSESKAGLERYKTLKSEIATYSEHLNGLYLLSKKKIETNEEAINHHIKSFNEFSKTVEGVLNDWQFPNITSLTFDTKYKEFDIRINNNPRSTNGKGYRALTYTAFIYGLMKYSLSKGRNHPGFMVFDSPLTTFKERDGAEELSETLSQNVEFAFFDSLAKDVEGQVIIFENKEPNTSLIEKMNYIHFSGQQAIGRPGFFTPGIPS
jgi:hypothetical protein